MAPIMRELTVEERNVIATRGYRDFIREYKDGSQDLITVYDNFTVVKIAHKEKFGRWSAPFYAEEIFS